MDKWGKSISIWADKTAFWLTFALPIFLVCFSAPILGVSVDAMKASVLIFFTAFTFILYLISKINRSNLSLKLNTGTILGLLFILIVVFASVFSGNFEVSFLGNGLEEPSGTTLLALIVFGFLFANYQKDNLKNFSLVFLGGYLFSTIVSIIFFLFPQILNLSTEFNLFGSLNSFSIISAIALILGVLLFEEGRADKKIAIISIASVILALIILIFTNSQMAFIFAGVILLVNFFERIILYRKDKFPVLSFIVITVLIFFGFGKSLIGNFFPKAINLETTEISIGLKTNIDLIENGLGENLLLGSGPGKFGDAWFKYQPEQILKTRFWNSSFFSGFNSISNIMLTTGVLGIASFVTLMVYALILFFKRKRIRNSLEHKISNTLFLSSFLALWLFSLEIGLLFLAFVLIFSIFSDAKDITLFQAEGITKRKISLFVLGAGLFMGVLFCLFATLKFSGLVLASHSQNILNTSSNLELAKIKANKSIKIFPNKIALENNFRIKRSLTISSLQSPSDESQVKISDSVLALERLIKYNPESYISWNMAGAYFSDLFRLNVSNAKEEAEKSLQEAISIFPNSPSFHLLLGRLYLLAGQDDLAKQNFEKTLILKDNYSEAYIYLAILEEKNSNMLIAEENYQKAIRLSASEKNFILLGDFYLRAENLDFAKEAFERAVALSSTPNKNAVKLALIYSDLGRKDEALNLIERILEIFPANENVLDAREKIISGESFADILLENKDITIP